MAHFKTQATICPESHRSTCKVLTAGLMGCTLAKLTGDLSMSTLMQSSCTMSARTVARPVIRWASDGKGAVLAVALRSPLGARALYLYRGGRDTFYRIHGTNDLESIGNSGSAGCIRMFNQDIIHLYNEIEVPMKVHIRSEAESLRVDPENFNRGRELPPKIISAEELLGPEAVALDRPPLLDET